MTKLIYIILILKKKLHKKISFSPSSEIIKANENLIIDNNKILLC